MVRILLVDDHPVVRQGIRQILMDGLKGVSVGEASDVASASASIRAAAWDVVVLDVTLPGASGLDLLKEIRHTRPALPVLVLSMHPATQFARRVLAAGAWGYLTKDSAPTELLHAIDQIRRGRLYLGSRIPDWARTPIAADAAPHDSLSDREYQVLRMIGSGLTVSGIASALGLSVKTVSTYRAHILEKMRLKNNAELMHYVLTNHLLD